jgi:polysaccharide biosynthesis/export protein
VKTILPALLTLLAASAGTGCASLGDYVWADQLPPQPKLAQAEYIIRPGDLLTVRVYGQEASSGTVRVRSDGRISLPLMADQVAEGLRPTVLAELLAARLKAYIRSPMVSVALEERHASLVSVVGQVAAPGSYPVSPGDGLLHALARAGGLGRFASEDQIFLVRGGADGRPPMRVRFRYGDLLEAEPRSLSIEVQDGDVVVVQ